MVSALWRPRVTLCYPHIAPSPLWTSVSAGPAAPGSDLAYRLFFSPLLRQEVLWLLVFPGGDCGSERSRALRSCSWSPCWESLNHPLLSPNCFSQGSRCVYLWCVCMCRYVSLCTCTCTRVSCAHTSLYMCACLHVSMYACVCTCACACICTCAFVCVCISVCGSVCMCACVGVHTGMFAYPHEYVRMCRCVHVSVCTCVHVL